jgi:ABC-type Fe3+-hydroxamate transport system substrate-binding protein
LLADAAGTVHEPAGPTARIVCLVPSVTELVCALGLAGQLVGRTGFCIHPRETVRRIAKVGGTKDVDIEAVRTLAPTHVIVNIDENRRDTAAALGAFVPNVIVTHPLGPADNPPLYRLIGGIFGRAEEAEQLCARFERALVEVRESGARLPAENVLYVIWREPWMTVSRDTYIARTLQLVNWWTLPSRSAQRYPEFTLDAALLREVDRILLSSEPYRFTPEHVAELNSRTELLGKPVSLIDGEMTSWYGSRAIEGLAYLARFRRDATL